MSRANKALLAALDVVMHGTQPNRMLVVRLKAAMPRSHANRITSFNYTVVERQGKLHIHTLESLQSPMQARTGIRAPWWNRAPGANHVAEHMASSPQAALMFLTSPRDRPRSIPTHIRLLHVDIMYETRTSDGRRANNARHSAATVIPAAARGVQARRNVYRPPSGPGFLAAMRRFRSMQATPMST